MPFSAVGAYRPEPDVEGHEGLRARWDNRPVRLTRRTGRLELLESQVARLLDRMNVAVIHGGDKTVDGAVINQTQNPRSWKSYQAVAQDIANSLAGLGCKNMRLLPDDMTLGDRLRKENIHFAWLNTGGVQGFDSMSHGAAMLELAGIPYVGHSPMTASILDNKHTFKRQLTALGIPTAAFMTWHLARGQFVPETNARFNEIFGDFAGPFIVKPVCGRASLHVNVVDTVADLGETVSQVYHATENHVLIEEFLPGAEFTVAVCGSITAHGRKLVQSNHPHAFSAIERVLTAEERIFTSMDVRPITKDRLRPLGPRTDSHIHEKLVDIARQVFTEMDLETLVRLDLRMDAQGRLNVLEANPKPDLKRPVANKTSIVCSGLSACGMDYDDLILSLLADRIDLLFCQRRGTVTALSALLD